MRIPCPCCGERGADEFSYLGDAAPVRPAPNAAMADWVDYAYLRDNPSGAHAELWYHAAGCHAWLTVTRDLRSHAILSVQRVQDRARA